MINTFKLAVLFFIGAFVSSCQKELDNIDPVIPPVQTDSLTRLSKFAIFYSDDLTDTAYTGYYTFDNLKRVTILNGYEYDNGNRDLLEIYTYYYISTDTIPYKGVHQEAGTINIDTTFYFYDNSQRLIRDSTLSVNIDGNTSVTIAEYIYSADKIIANIHGYATGTSTPYSNTYSDTGFIGSNGKVVKTTTSNDLTAMVNISYDDHPNPFYQLNIHPLYYPIPDLFFDIYDDYLLKNNVTSIDNQNLLYPPGSSTVAYSYTYNSLGLPETATSRLNNTQEVDEIVVFTYTKL